MKIFLLLLLTLVPHFASARVFNLDKQKLAFYMKGSFGSSRMERDAFAFSDGATANVTETVEFQYAGEMGVYFNSAEWGFRAGVLGVYPQVLDGVEAKNVAGAVEYNLTSRVFGVIPVGHIEYALISNSEFRWYVSLGGGIGSVTILNSYAFTASSPYGLIDFTEEGTAWVPMYEGSTGFEFSLADNVTMLFDAGYRHLMGTGFKHTRAANTFVGEVSKGSKMTNVGGGEREVDMISMSVGLGFKFYFL